MLREEVGKVRVGRRWVYGPMGMTQWRASLVPAAAVIPAPIAYIKVVAVKKLVVGFLGGCQCPLVRVCSGALPSFC